MCVDNGFQLTRTAPGVRVAPWNHVCSALAFHLTFFALHPFPPSLCLTSLSSFVFQSHEIKTSEEKKNIPSHALMVHKGEKVASLGAK